MLKVFPNPKRRDVKQLNAWAATISAGDHVSVVFSDDRHGIFRIDGSAHAGISAGELSLGGWDLRTAKNAVPKAVRAVATEPVPEGMSVEVSDVGHGELATVAFEQKPYGIFRITGFATESHHDSFVMIGSWILSNRGQLAPRVRSVKVHENTEGLSLPAVAHREPLKMTEVD